MRISVGELRGVIGEEVGRLMEAKSKSKPKSSAKKQQSWSAWYAAFETALVDAGYGSLSDLPMFDFASSEDETAADEAISMLTRMHKDGKTPQEAVVELEGAPRLEGEDESDDLGEDESAFDLDGAIERLEDMAAQVGYKFVAPYSWGSGDEAVELDAAITDDYGSWIIGLDRDGIILHTADDDIEMTEAELETLLDGHDVDDLIEMSTEEINGLIGR